MWKKFLGDGVSMVVPSHYHTKAGHFDAAVDERGIYTSMALATSHFFVYKYDDENRINRSYGRMCEWGNK